MLKSDVDLLVENWFLKDKYVFITYNWFNLDYIVIERVRDEEFVTCKNSTSDMGSFTREEMVYLIGMNIFIYQPSEHWNQDFHYVRSNGCTCGAASTANPDKHAFNCKKWTK
jgi:hypothetical protein